MSTRTNAIASSGNRANAEAFGVARWRFVPIPERSAVDSGRAQLRAKAAVFSGEKECKSLNRSFFAMSRQAKSF
jgi:hypothetical protein